MSILFSVSNKHTYKRVRLDPNEEDSKGVKVDCPSGDAKACNDVLSIPKVTCHISPGKKNDYLLLNSICLLRCNF